MPPSPVSTAVQQDGAHSSEQLSTCHTAGGSGLLCPAGGLAASLALPPGARAAPAHCLVLCDREHRLSMVSNGPGKAKWGEDADAEMLSGAFMISPGHHERLLSGP